VTIRPAGERVPGQGASAARPGWTPGETGTVVLANVVTALAIGATWQFIVGSSVARATWWAVTATMAAVVLGLVTVSLADWIRLRAAQRLAGTYILPAAGGLLIWLVGSLPFVLAVGMTGSRGENLRVAIIVWPLIAVLVIGQGVLSRRSRIAACLAPATASAGLAMAIYLAGL
jgi:hypothetical protein